MTSRAVSRWPLPVSFVLVHTAILLHRHARELGGFHYFRGDDHARVFTTVSWMASRGWLSMPHWDWLPLPFYWLRMLLAIAPGGANDPQAIAVGSNIVLGGACLLLVWLTTLRASGEPLAAAWALWLASLLPLVHQLSVSAGSEPMLWLCVLAGAALWADREAPSVLVAFAAAAFWAAASLTRYEGWLLLLPFGVLLFRRTLRERSGGVLRRLPLAALLIPVAAYILWQESLPPQTDPGTLPLSYRGILRLNPRDEFGLTHNPLEIVLGLAGPAGALIATGAWLGRSGRMRWLIGSLVSLVGLLALVTASFGLPREMDRILALPLLLGAPLAGMALKEGTLSLSLKAGRAGALVGSVLALISLACAARRPFEVRGPQDAWTVSRCIHRIARSPWPPAIRWEGPGSDLWAARYAAPRAETTAWSPREPLEPGIVVTRTEEGARRTHACHPAGATGNYSVFTCGMDRELEAALRACLAEPVPSRLLFARAG